MSRNHAEARAVIHTLSKPRPEPICGMDTWMPAPARIGGVREENFNTRTFTTEFADEEIGQMYRFAPGQFNMLYVPGVGEAAFPASSDPAESKRVAHTIRRVGSVTRTLWRIEEGGMIGLRGPFGRGWPMDEMQDRHVVIVAGGIGIAPLRPVVYALLREPGYCKRLVLLYGCRTPEEEDRIRQIRRDCRTLITIGACATSGGIQALRNWGDVEDFSRYVYPRPDEIEALVTSTPIASHVFVDYELRGCPINPNHLLELVSAAGRSIRWARAWAASTARPTRTRPRSGCRR